jgi:hypothetical protein
MGEPAAIGGVVAAILNLIVLLVLDQELSIEEQAAIVGAVTLVAGLFIRSRVTPVA